MVLYKNSCGNAERNCRAEASPLAWPPAILGRLDPDCKVSVQVELSYKSGQKQYNEELAMVRMNEVKM